MIDGQKAEDRTATDRAAQSLTKAMTGNMNALVAGCEGDCFKLACVESMLTQMIDGLTEDRLRVQRAIQAARRKEN